MRKRRCPDAAVAPAEELVETAHLLPSSTNAKGLLRALRRSERGKTILPPWSSCGEKWASQRGNERNRADVPQARYHC
jgi:hypothetical protein